MIIIIIYKDHHQQLLRVASARIPLPLSLSLMHLPSQYVFNKNVPISLLKSKPLKLVEQFMYLDSNISSTESDVNIRKIKHSLLLAGQQLYGNLITLIE